MTRTAAAPPRSAPNPLAAPVLRALAASGLPTEEFAELAGPLGVTPKETIHAEGTLKLQHFRPLAESVYRVPVLIVTSLVVVMFMVLTDTRWSTSPTSSTWCRGRAWSSTSSGRASTST